METLLSSKQIIIDISSMRNIAILLFGKGKDYEPLLEAILSKNYYYTENHLLPSLKELQEKIGLKYPVIRKYLNNIYTDLLMHEEIGIDFSIKELEYIFDIVRFDKYATFVVKSIPVLPRVGDEIYLPFLNAKVGTKWFYVYSIDHSFNDTKQSICISLRAGSYNKFLEIKKDEEYIKGHLTIEDYLSLDNYELAKKLGYHRY
jgi:hypothetical protein